MIEGIKIIPIKTHEDERGFFREIFRFQEQFTNPSVGQLSHSLVREGVIKGWHGHVYQSPSGPTMEVDEIQEKPRVAGAPADEIPF